MAKAIENFIAIVQRANLRKDTDVRLSIDDANKLHTAISNLLLELKECQNPSGPRIINGGTFK